MCASIMDRLPSNVSFNSAINVSSQDTLRFINESVVNDAELTMPFASTVCVYFPSYYSNYAILILVATSVVVQLTHVCKFILMLIIAGK